MERFETLLNVRRDEWRPLLIFGSYLFIVIGNMILLTSIGDALFLSNYTSEYIPISQIVIALTLSALALGYNVLSTRISHAKLSVAAPVFFAFLLFAAWWLLWLDIPGFIFFLNVLITAICDLSIILAWSFVVNGFDVRQTNRIMPILGALTSVGAILGGAATTTLVLFTSSENLILIGCVSFCAMSLLAISGNKLIIEQPIVNETHGSFWQQSLQGFGFIQRNPLVRNVAIILIIWVVAKNLISYEFKVVLQEEFKKDQIAEFLGAFYAIGNVIELLFQLFITGHLLRYLKLQNSFTVNGAIILTLALLLFWQPLFAFIAALKFSEGFANRILQSPNMATIYSAIPAKRSQAIKITLDGVIAPIITIATSMAIIFVPGLSQTHSIAIILIVLGVIWVSVSRTLNRLYIKELSDAIHTRMFNGDSGLSQSGGISVQLIELLEKQLSNSGEPQKIFILRLIAEHQITALAPSVWKLLPNSGSAVKLEAIATLRAVEPVNTDALLNCLATETNPEVISALLRVLRTEHSERILQQAKLYTEHENVKVRSEAIFVMFQQGDLEDILTAAEYFTAMRNSGVDGRIRLAEMLGYLQETTLQRTFIKLLEDPHPDVRDAALKASSHFHTRPILRTLIKELNGNNLLIVRQSFINSGGIGVEVLVESFAANPINNSELNSVLSVFGAHPNAQSLCLLSRWLEEQHSVLLRQKLFSTALLFKSSGFQLDRELLQKQFNRELFTIFQVIGAQEKLNRKLNQDTHDKSHHNRDTHHNHNMTGTPAQPDTAQPGQQLQIETHNRDTHNKSRLLIHEMQQQYELSLQRLFMILELMYDNEVIIHGSRVFTMNDRTLKANTLELLDNLLSNATEKLFLTLLEKSSPLNWLDEARIWFKNAENEWHSDAISQRETTDWHCLLHSEKYSALANTIKLAEHLITLHFFAHVPWDILQHLANECEIKQYSSGTKIITLGQEQVDLYFLISGQAAVTDSEGSTTDCNQGILGNVYFTQKAKSTLSANCTSDSQIIKIPIATIARLCEEYESFADSILKGLLQSIREASAQESLFLEGNKP